MTNPRLPMPATENDVGRWRVLTDAIFPRARSADSILMALDYCKARGLDPLKRPVNIVPMYDERERRWIETIWPSIMETQTTAARTGQWAGMDSPTWGPDITEKFSREDGSSVTVTYPEWCSVTVYRIVEGQKAAFVEPVYWIEAVAKTKGAPNGMWCRRPRGQLHKNAKAASLRAAFPEESAGPTAEEMEGQPFEAELSSPTAAPVVAVAKITATKKTETAPEPPEGDPEEDAGGEDTLAESDTQKELPPADPPPTTNSGDPHKLEKFPADDWRNWGKAFVEAIDKALTGQQVGMWRMMNTDMLAQCENEDPKAHARLLARIKRRENELAQ